MKKVALIVAGGKGNRMNSDIPKQFLLLKGTPILMQTLKQFSHLDELVLVLPRTQFEYWETLCKNHNFTQEHTLVAGGINRFESVRNGLSYIADAAIVAIHDGARPLVTTSLINSSIELAENGIGVIPVVSVKDSIRKVVGNDSAYIDRSILFKVQTPQCFLSTDIKKAYTQGFSELFTDDASVFEAYGGVITTVIGEEKNLKITTQEDLKIASILF